MKKEISEDKNVIFYLVNLYYDHKYQSTKSETFYKFCEPFIGGLSSSLKQRK